MISVSIIFIFSLSGGYFIPKKGKIIFYYVYKFFGINLSWRYGISESYARFETKLRIIAIINEEWAASNDF